MRRKRAGDNVVANTHLNFQHSKTAVVDDLVAHIDTKLATSPPLLTADFTARTVIVEPDAPVDPYNPCMNGGVFFVPEPAVECSFFHHAQAFQINKGESLGSVPIVANFELSFTLLVNNVPEYLSYNEIINIQDPNQQLFNKESFQSNVFIQSSLGVNWLIVVWKQSLDLQLANGIFSPYYIASIPSEMVIGGTYDIKIRVKSGILKVYIDGLLKSEGEVDVIETQENQELVAIGMGGTTKHNTLPLDAQCLKIRKKT